jgi:ferredoxin
MPVDTSPEKAIYVLETGDFQTLLDAVMERGHSIFGPVLRDGAITYDALHRDTDLPLGWNDRQQAGSYRLVKTKRKTFFAYAVGPHSWKKFLHPPSDMLCAAQRIDDRFSINEPDREHPRRAFLGVRSCELHALAIHDKIFTDGPFINEAYRRRRQDILIIAVNCSHPSETCFCTSLQTGPRATGGFDLALTEVLTSGNHHFIIETGSAAGAELCARLPVRKAARTDIEAAEKVTSAAAKKIRRSLNTEELRETLDQKFSDPHWGQIADRCLACGNCTMVCPTCFCSTVEDTTTLTGEHAERRLKWDSCFTAEFSYIHGGSIRSSTLSRYRQWLTHKLAYWFDQFGMCGCVGCGRCITWCPAGIDLTEETRKLQEKKFVIRRTNGR